MPIDRRTSLKDLLAAATIDLQELSRRDAVMLELRPLEAWALLGNLQLALTIDPNRGAAERIGRRIAKLLENAVAITPALKEVVRRGWKGNMEVWLH